MKLIRLQAGVFTTDGRYSETRFFDGSCVPAVPEDTDEYRQRARELGYGEDTAALSREHEFAHSFLAEALGLEYSPVLWAVAHGQARPEGADEEEAMVMQFQRLLAGRETTESLFLQRLAERARELIR